MTKRIIIRALIAVSIVTLLAAAAFAGQVRVTDLRYSGNSAGARVVLELSGSATYTVNEIKNPERVYIDLHNTKLLKRLARSMSLGKGGVGKIRASQFDARTSRVVMDMASGYSYKVFRLDNPSRVVLDFFKSDSGGNKPAKVNYNKASTMASALAKLRKLEKKKAILRAQLRAEEKLRQGNVKKSAPVLAKPAKKKPAPFVRTAKADVKTYIDTPAAKKPPLKVQVIKEDIAIAPAASVTKKKNEAKELAKIRAAKLKAKSASAAIKPVLTPKPNVTAKRARIVVQKSGPKLIKKGKFKRHRIVIDAGHGGKDPGASAHGLREKDIVLDIAKRLKRKLEAMGGYEVILTRSRDKFLELEERSAFANDKNADLFVSVHANASRNKRARGLETYYLNMNSDEDSIKVAARENQVPIEKMRKAVNEFDMILTSLTVQNKGYESAKLAKDVLENMYDSVERRYHGVTSRQPKMGPFYVLYGSRMPSVLVEVSYITNKTEATRLRTSTYRDYLADGIARGLRDYLKKASRAAEIARR